MTMLAAIQNFVLTNPLGRFLALFSAAGFLAILFRGFLRVRKIQPSGFKWRALRTELLFAVINLAVTSFVLGGTTAFLTKHGYIKFNTTPTSGWFIGLENALYFFAFDAYFYWLHRLMHIKPIYT